MHRRVPRFAMRIAEVIGTVVLGRCHPSFQGATLKAVVPLSLDNLTGKTPPGDELVVAWDELGAGIGSRIALAEGPDAAMPFRPNVKPVNAYNAAILDQIDLRVPEK